jgi:lycopene cyclase CruA
MPITYTTTAEFDRSPTELGTVLSDPTTWAHLLPRATRAGRYWRFGDDLYEVAFSADGDCLRWVATDIAGRGARLQIHVALRDALINSVADIVLALDAPTTLSSLLGRRRMQRAAARLGTTAIQKLQQLLGQPSADHPSSIAHPLANRYPRTVAAFAGMGALDHLNRIARLDATWDAIRRPSGYADSSAPSARHDIYSLISSSHLAPPVDFDLIYAGGGLGLLHAVVMAHYGYRVLLFDRGEVGCAHREWNISREELRALIDTGFCDWDELRDVVMTEYEAGVVRFHRPERPVKLWMRDVLNVALDASALLRLARRKLEAAGGVVLDRRAFRGVEVAENGAVVVRVELACENGSAERYTARLLLDGMGSGSPLALRRFAGQPFAGVCPTVGTVAAGFAAGDADDEHNPRVGDILISVADAQRGQQYMWEGFPSRADALTVYLFYYDTLARDERRKTETNNLSSLAPRPSPVNLMLLFEDYFALLPTYKRPGPHFRHLKPVYGYIPARHSLRRQEAPLLRGVLPIGDSAAQQSPLTFCGFGSHVRNLGRTTSLLHEALGRDLLAPAHLHPISAYQVNVSLNWVFSRFMQPWQSSDDVNRLQNVFLSVLGDLGEDLARRFFRDRMRWSDYHRIVLGMFRRYPPIAAIAWRVLGPAGVRRWIGDYLAYSRAALAAVLGRRLGSGGRAALAALLGRAHPALGLRLRARFAEWRAMGWL